MVRRPLPTPPGSNVGPKHGNLPPEPKGASPPPAVVPRGARPLPEPAQERVVSAGDTYESVDISDEKVNIQQPEEFYDDFDSSFPQDPQETYDDFGLGGAAPKHNHAQYDDGEELYDEMVEGHSVTAAKLPPPPQNTGRGLPPLPTGNVGKAPPLPSGRRPAPPPPESPSDGESQEEYDEYQEEWYDEMTEGPSVAAAKPPPPPPNTGRALPPPPAADVGKAQRERRPMPLPKEPSSPDEIEERCESPENYDPDEMQDTYEADLYLGSNEENSSQDEYEEGFPPPPIDILPPHTSRPALPDKPAAPKKLLPPKVDGFDPSQILKIKLKKVEGNTQNKAAQKKEETIDFRAVLHKTPQGTEIKPPVQPLQPPVLKKKNVTSNGEKTSNPEESKAQKVTEKSTPAPKKVLVSPPPVNMSSHPPAQKPSVLPQPPEPKVAVTAPTVKTALVRPERKLPEPPVEDISKPNEQADSLDIYPWYHGMIERDEARDRLNSEPGDGVFLVRKSRKGSDTQPYTLVILYEGHFFNLKIRCRPEDQKIALGEEKRGEMAFSSVPSLISYHRDHNVILIGNPGGETKLTKHPRRPN